MAGRGVRRDEGGHGAPRRARRRLARDGGAPALWVLATGAGFVAAAFGPMRSHLEALAVAAAQAQLGGPDAAPELLSTATVEITALTVIYATLQLFTMNAPAVEAVDAPTWLAWARVLAPGIGITGFVIGLNRVLRARLHAQMVRWYRGHEVLCYGEMEALRWAKGGVGVRRHGSGGRTLLVMPDLSEDTRRELQLLGVRPLVAADGDPARGAFSNAVSGAQKVVVDLNDDVTTLEFALAAREVAAHRPSRSPAPLVVAYVASPTLESLTTAISAGSAEDDPLSRIVVTSKERELVRGMQLHRDGRRAPRGPLHLAIAGGGPSIGLILDAIVGVLEPAEEARVTLLHPPGAPLPTFPARLHVDVVAQPVESMASAIHDLARRLASDPTRADLGSPVVVHLDDVVRSALVVAGLGPLKDAGQRLAVVPPTGTPRDSVLLDEFIDAGDGSGPLRVIRPTDIGTLTHLDAVSRALSDAARSWSHIGVCGEHPADALLDLLGRERRRGDGGFPQDVLHDVLISLNASGLALRPRRPDRSARAHFAMQHHVDRLARDLGHPELAEREAPRSPDTLHGRVALAHFVMYLEQLVLAACDLAFEATEQAPEPLWLAEEDLRTMARSIHEHYRSGLPGHDRGRATDVTWDELDEIHRESNIAQARRIPIKVAALGLQLARVEEAHGRTWPNGCEPSEAQLSELGELEHRLWSASLFARGYEHGPERSRSTHPDLVPYAQLGPETREKDMDTVRALPTVLSAAGLALERPLNEVDARLS